ncbi:hypothetical protein BDR22DRAFT_815754 [Usnea florida]
MSSVPGATAPVSFENAFDRLREVVSKDDARSFHSTRMEDVWTTAKAIERHLESRRSLRGFHRIQPFLAGIEQYSKVVEVLCNGTPYLPYLWAPIKLLLQIAQGHIKALEKLIDAYAMIGEAMPRFDRLSAAFKDDKEFSHVMSHFYEDILEFHRRAYMFFRRRAWKIVFDSLWKTFRLRFQGILESLRKHRDLIDAEANAIGLAEAKAWRVTQLDHIRQWRADRAYDIETMERERLTSQTRAAMTWFNANEDQENIYAKISRACDGSDNHWILKEPIIISWLGQGVRDHSVIWLNGKPGADIAVIYYFCNHQQASQTQASEVLRSFATQLLAQNTTLAPYILEQFVNSGQKPTKRNLGKILERLIATLGSLRIVVDGIDECGQDDQDEIIEDLLRIKGPVVGACKLLLSSRKHPSISRWLHSKPTIRLDDNTDHVNSTISSFIRPRLQSLRNRFSPAVVDGLGDLLLAKANGMFLWIRLVMFTLADLYFESDVREAMETLPEDIEAVYERILTRICGSGKTPNQRIAIRILQWMVVTRRPLKRSELESGIILHEQVSRITTSNRPRGDVLSLCYPLLDVEDDPGSPVRFTHFTAQEYLRKTDKYPSLQPKEAQLTVSLSCILYLQSSLEFVDPRIAEEDKHSSVALLFHELHLYAVDHWIDHLLALSELVDSHHPGCDLRLLFRGLERLTEMHNELAALNGWNLRDEHNPSLSPGSGSWHSLHISPPAKKLLDASLTCRTDAFVNDSLTAKSCSKSPVLPCLRSSMLRTTSGIGDLSIFDAVPLDSNPLYEYIPGVTEVILDDFKAKHCSGAFFCRHRKCPRAVQGFNTPELRQMHEESHVPKFQCTEVACGFFGWPFNTQAAFKKHNIQYHDEEKIASMPDSLANVQCRSRKDRSLFTLTKSNQKRRVEEINSPGAPSGGTFVESDDDELSRANANEMQDQKPTGPNMSYPESDLFESMSPMWPDNCYKDVTQTAGFPPDDCWVDFGPQPMLLTKRLRS